MALSPYVPFEGNLNADYIVQPSDWNGMFGQIADYMNNVIAVAVNSLFNSLGGVAANQGRLYGISGNPIGDTASTSNLYFGPTLLGNAITLQSGTSLIAQTFSEITIPLSGLTANTIYDVYIQSASSNTVSAVFVAWSGNTQPTRGVDLAGRPCKNGATGALWVGAFIALTATTTKNTQASRWIANAYNTVPLPLSASIASFAGALTTPTTLHGIDGQDRISALFLPTNPLFGVLGTVGTSIVTSGNFQAAAGMALDSTTAYSGMVESITAGNSAGGINPGCISVNYTPPTPLTGSHFFQMLVQSASGNGDVQYGNYALLATGMF